MSANPLNCNISADITCVCGADQMMPCQLNCSGLVVPRDTSVLCNLSLAGKSVRVSADVGATLNTVGTLFLWQDAPQCQTPDCDSRTQPELAFPTCQLQGSWRCSSKRNLSSAGTMSTSVIIGLAVAMSIVLLTAVLGISLWRWRRQGMHNREMQLELQALVPEKVGQQLMLAYGHLFGVAALEAKEAQFTTLEVARRAVQLERLIGEGQSGSVFLGQLRMQGLRQTVAVKMGVVAGAAPTLAREEALQMEARLLYQLRHPHIVSVLAVVTRTQPSMLCLEFMTNGDLKTYLRHVARVVCFSSQACGLRRAWGVFFGAGHADQQ
jgi:hypothetical protein